MCSREFFRRLKSKTQLCEVKMTMVDSQKLETFIFNYFTEWGWN